MQVFDGEFEFIPPEPNYDFHQTGSQIGFIPRYLLDYDAREVDIEDNIWGDVHIGDWEGDTIFGELYTNPGIQRMADIEQLTLPKEYTTLPWTADFTRWQHIWGSVAFTRRMIENAEARGRQFDPQEKLTLQMRTFLSDVGHTAFSHLGDWLKQGFGGTEDSHDEELARVLEMSGIDTILERYGLPLEEVVFPEDKDDWIECSSPDLCVDRVDYGVREIVRWVEPAPSTEEWVRRYEVTNDDQLIMTSEDAARQFAADYALLPTEHWSHPIHQLQLHLFSLLIKGGLIEHGTPLSGGSAVLNPLDMLYSTDSDLMASTKPVGSLNYDLPAIMIDIGRSQRRIFAHGRESEIKRYLTEVRLGVEGVHFPDPVKSMTEATEYTGLMPGNVELVAVTSIDEIADFNSNRTSFDVFLPALKPRYVDPLYRDANGKIVRISDTDPVMRKLLEQQRQLQKQAYVARIHMAPTAADRLKKKIEQTEENWDYYLARFERTPIDEMQGMFRMFGNAAMPKKRITNGQRIEML